jgi:monoterpene epsilon-lactone hydrolase
MAASIQSRLIFQVLKHIKFKKIIEKRSTRKPARKKCFVPRFMPSKFTLSHQTIFHRRVVTIELIGRTDRNHIVFLHGGAYIFQANRMHWELAEKIVKTCRCKMTMIEYPLAPEHDYLHTFEMLDQAYVWLRMQNPEDNFIFMGDSSGGGLALSFTQKLIKENKMPLPHKLILLSPWLDMSLSNPDMSALAEKDLMMTRKMLDNAAKLYSNGYDRKNPLLSPIYGDFNQIPDALIFFGTEEMFYADCIKLQKKLSGINSNIVFRVYEDMQHDWAIFPIPEREKLINEVCDFI